MSFGRWPANLIHDGSDEVVALFPSEAGAAAPVRKRNADKFRNSYGAFAGDIDEAGSTFRGDSGSAARFFYCAKASKSDRNSGLNSIVDVKIDWSETTKEGLWDQEARQVRLLVDTELSPPRVTAVFGAQNSNATEWSTMLFGSCITEPYQQVSTCTTGTKINLTTPSEIWSFFQGLTTSASTQAAKSEMASGGSHAEIAAHGLLHLTITSEKMGSALGASHVASPMQLKISASAAKSGHPTVKPTDLMAYLCRLVTPPGGTVLDPFMGSGSTGKAAMREGFQFIGVDLSAEYVEIAKARIQAEVDKIALTTQPPSEIAHPDLFSALS